MTHTIRHLSQPAYTLSSLGIPSSFSVQVISSFWGSRGGGWDHSVAGEHQISTWPPAYTTDSKAVPHEVPYEESISTAGPCFLRRSSLCYLLIYTVNSSHITTTPHSFCPQSPEYKHIHFIVQVGTRMVLVQDEQPCDNFQRLQT